MITLSENAENAYCTEPYLFPRIVVPDPVIVRPEPPLEHTEDTAAILARSPEELT